MVTTPTFNHEAEEVFNALGISESEFKQTVEQALDLAQTIAQAYMLEEPKALLLFDIAKDFCTNPFDPFRFSILTVFYAKILSDCFDQFVFQTQGGDTNA